MTLTLLHSIFDPTLPNMGSFFHHETLSTHQSCLCKAGRQESIPILDLKLLGKTVDPSHPSDFWIKLYTVIISNQ